MRIVGPDSPVGIADESEFDSSLNLELILTICPSSIVGIGCMFEGLVTGEGTEATYWLVVSQ